MQSKGLLIISQFFKWCILNRKLVFGVFWVILIFISVYLLEFWNIGNNIRLATSGAKDINNGYTTTTRLKFHDSVLQANKLLLKDFINPALLDWKEGVVYQLPLLSAWVRQVVDTTKMDKNNKPIREIYQGIDVHEGYIPIQLILPLDSIMSSYDFDAFMNYVVAKTWYKGEITSFNNIYMNFMASNVQFVGQYKEVAKYINKLYNAYLIKVDQNENYLFLLKKTSGELKDLQIDEKGFNEQLEKLITSYYDEIANFITSRSVEIENQGNALGGAMQYLKENTNAVLATIETMKKEALEKERTILSQSLSGLDSNNISIESVLTYTQEGQFYNHDLLQLLVR